MQFGLHGLDESLTIPRTMRSRTSPIAAGSPPPDRGPSRIGKSAAAVFFVSGAAGLIFEVVWFVRCGLVFGNSVWATSIVLSSFMAGLAVGNALCGLFGARFSRPLLAYAGLEAIAGVTGILVTYALVALPPVVASVTGGRLDSGPLSEEFQRRSPRGARHRRAGAGGADETTRENYGMGGAKLPQRVRARQGCRHLPGRTPAD